MAKRLFDLLFGTILLCLTVPLILILAVALTIDLRAFPFFVQRRIGRGGVELGFLKLRTLPPDTPAYALKHELDVAISPLCSFLRRRHIDELPQLLHVLTGKLSLVGPRPRMPDSYEPVDPAYASARVTVPQGCTGLWQIGTDVELLPSEAPEYDLFYVRNATLRMDIWVLWRTALQTLGLAQGVALADVPAFVLPGWRAPVTGVALRGLLGRIMSALESVLPPLRPALAAAPAIATAPRPRLALAPSQTAPSGTGVAAAVDRVIDLRDAHSGGSPRVVIAHDYVTQRGGAERVVLGLLQAFPGARLVTSVYSPETTFPEFADYDIQTLWLDRHDTFRRDPRRAFPFLAKAWENHTIEDADVVVCSSSGWAHGVTTSAPKVIYCHNPARWLYQPSDYLADGNVLARAARSLLARPLIRWDRRRAASAARYVVNSTVVARRVLETYGRDSTVIPPPITLDASGPQERVPGIAPGFLLSVARARGYKNVELVCEAVDGIPSQRLVVLGDLPQRADGSEWSSRLEGVGRVSDAQLRWLYANCAAVVSASHEDFGLTPLEGNMFGKPAIVLHAGGFLDTVVEGMNGTFITEETVAGVRDAIRRLPAVNPFAVRTYAAGFRQAVFAQRMRQVVDEVLSGAPAPERELNVSEAQDDAPLARPA